MNFFTDLERQHGLPNGLLNAVMQAESGGNPNAVSPKGALGSFQFMPKTAQAYGINPLDPNQAAQGAARMYADLSKQYKGDLPSMLAAYNWGSGNLAKYGMEKAPEETRNYIQKVSSSLPTGLSPEEQAELNALNDELGLTPEEQAELDQLNAELGDSGQKQPDVGLSPAQEFQNEQPLLRTAARGGRAVASGLASIADLALLAPKTAALGIGLGAEKMGAPEIGGALQKFGMIPTMADTSKAIIDKATGNRLKPTGIIDSIGDFAGEMISSAAPFAKGDDALRALKSPTAKDAVSAVLNPQQVAKNVFVNKYPAPEKITAEIIRKQSGAAYKAAQEKGGILKPETVDRFLDDLQRTVKPQDELAQALSKDDPANEVMDILEKMARGKEMNLDRLQALDEVLSNKIDNFIEFGKPKKEGLGLIKIQDQLREMVENAAEADIVGSKEGFRALKEGRKLWAKAAKLRDIERIITRAEMSEQPANAMRNGFKSLFNNPKRMSGFSKEEAKAIEKAAESGILGEILRGPASRLTGIISGAVGGVPGYLGGKAVEMSARGMGAALQAKRASSLADLVASGPKASGPLLTYQGNLAALGTTNAAGQKLLPKPTALLEYAR